MTTATPTTTQAGARLVMEADKQLLSQAANILLFYPHLSEVWGSDALLAGLLERLKDEEEIQGVFYSGEKTWTLCNSFLH